MLAVVFMFCLKAEAQFSHAFTLKAEPGIDSLTAKYIDPSASSNGNGTKTNPWNGSTLDGSWTANTVYLFKRGTTFSRSGRFNIQVPGVTLGAYGSGARPIIETTSTSVNNIQGIGSLTVQDLELISPDGNVGNNLAFANTTGSYLTVTNCKMHEGSSGIWVDYGSTMDVKITNCEIYNCWSDGIFIFQANSLEIGNCHIYNVNTSHPNYPDDGDCIHSDDTHTIWIHDNILDHSSEPGKFCLILAMATPGFTTNAMVERNIMTRSRTGTDNTITYSNYSKGSTIVYRYNKFQNALLAIQSRTYDMQFYYNTFSNLDLVMETNPSSNSNQKFYNNTVYNCGQLISGYGYPTTENVDFKNNIVHTITGIAFPSEGSNLTTDYNDYYNITSFTNQSASEGPHDISNDPLFSNLGSLDFTLTSGSPCINTGTTVSSPSFPSPLVDLNGNRVPNDGSAVDMGAYEFIEKDTIAPSIPSGLASANLSSSGFTLSWTTSTDNVRVVLYYIYKDGLLTDSTAGNMAEIIGLVPATAYSMTVKARDAAGNLSEASAAMQVTTLILDTEKPSIPTGLTASAITDSSLTLTWTASTDNIGVTGYVIVKNITFYSSITGTSVNITGLFCGASYTMGIVAFDASGNHSDTGKIIVTPACSSVPTNIAPTGTGTYWRDLPGELSNDNPFTSALINDNDTITNLGLEPDVLNAGDYQGIGIIWTTPQAGISKVKFYNGTYQSIWQNGYFEANMELQSSTNGSTWTNVIGWSCSPVYPYDSTASNKLFTFSGPTVDNVMGIRVIGQERLAVSYHIIIKELKVIATPVTLTSTIAIHPILIYPNPAADELNIQVAESATVSIFNVQGKLLVSKQIQQGTTTLPISLESGLYIIRVHGQSNSVYTGKLMVQ